jgi:hypothetical protein
VAKILAVPDPRGLTFDRWYAQILGDLAGYVDLPIGLRDDDWQTLARMMAYSGDLVVEGVPGPENYGSWQEWAAAWAGGQY